MRIIDGNGTKLVAGWVDHRTRSLRGPVVGLFAQVLFIATALATQISPDEVDDPFSDGKCPGQAILSFGSYIYDAPSKFDGVYWPATDSRWLWLCPQSGYASLGSDFEEISASEHEKIAEFLRTSYVRDSPPVEYLDRLTWAEQIYRLRDKDEAFWAYFYRLSAYWHDQETDAAGAMTYRRKALPILERLAESLPPGVDRIQHLFLAGEYHRRLGNTDRAMEYFARARTVEWTDDDGERQVGHEYFNELIAEREPRMR